MRPSLPLPLALLLMNLALSGQEALPTAGSVTEPGRSLERALDVLLGSNEAGRTVFFVLDPTPELAAAQFPSRLAEALERNRERLGGVEFGLARIGDRRLVALAPVAEPQALVRAAEQALETPSREIQNLYAPLRRLAQLLAGKSGQIDIILVSLENGDGEDDLEGTVAALQKARIRVSVIAREAYLSDSFWAGRPGQAPRGLSMAGGDGPFIDLPWGWFLQFTQANEVTPSGFAAYGLGRIAAATAGKVFLYSAPDASGHRCWVPGTTCPFCSNDHIVPGEAYRTGAMEHFAPLLSSRKDAYKLAAGDPYWRAVFRAWQRADKAGLVRSRPALKAAGSGYVPESNQIGRFSLLTGSLNFGRLAAQAEKLAEECGQIALSLEEEMGRAASGAHFPRFRAMADLTLIMFHLTRVNLFAFRAWCLEVAPLLAGKERLEPTPPEIPLYTREEKYTGVGWTGLSLCHGVAPFLGLRLPGGQEWHRSLLELDGRVSTFLERYEGTPYALAVRRSSIARFHLIYPGIAVDRDRDRFASKAAQDQATGTPRPPRAGAPGGSPGTSGPTTGGR